MTVLALVVLCVGHFHVVNNARDDQTKQPSLDARHHLAHALQSDIDTDKIIVQSTWLEFEWPCRFGLLAIGIISLEGQLAALSKTSHWALQHDHSTGKAETIQVELVRLRARALVLEDRDGRFAAVENISDGTKDAKVIAMCLDAGDL